MKPKPSCKNQALIQARAYGMSAALMCFFLLIAPAILNANQPKSAASTSGPEALSGAAAERVYFSDLRKYPVHRPNAEVPESITSLQGQEIEIVGYMVPFDRIENITKFILLQAPFMGCMHVPPPGPHETLMIETEQPMASYTQDAIRISGKIDIDEVYIDGYLVSVYTINATNITSASDSEAELDDLPDNFHMY